MNARQKAKKAKENEKRLNKKINELEEQIKSMWLPRTDYRAEEQKRLIENTLKLFIKRHYGRIEHTATRIEIDEREIEGMQNYRIEVERILWNRTISILVK